MPFLTGNDSTDDSGYAFRFEYDSLRSLLTHNIQALTLMGDLEADLNHMRYFDMRVKAPVMQLIDKTLMMAQELNLMTKDRHSDLYPVLCRIKTESRALLKKTAHTPLHPVAVSLDSDISLDSRIAGENASVLCGLKSCFGDAVPAGFILTTAGYNMLLEHNRLTSRISLLMKDITPDTGDETFESTTAVIRQWIKTAEVPERIQSAISEFSQKIDPDGTMGWIVGPSPVHNGTTRSVQGYHRSETPVNRHSLIRAWLDVIADRFTRDAVTYRINSGLRDVHDPMAVLLMPRVPFVVRGSVQTTDLSSTHDNIIVNIFRSPAGPLTGETPVIEQHYISSSRFSDHAAEDKTVNIPVAGEAPLDDIGQRAWTARNALGHDLEIEWGVDETGCVHFLHGRRLKRPPSEEASVKRRRNAGELAAGGVTVFPGRAEGGVFYLRCREDLKLIRRGAVVVVDSPEEYLVPVLPRIAALIAVKGNITSPVAALIRELSLPAIFNMEGAAERVAGKRYVSVNTAKRIVYEGSRWPGIRERVLSRTSGRCDAGGKHPLHSLLFPLNLNTPDSPDFRAGLCESVHDALWFMHEMSVRTLFKFGDQQKRNWKKRTCLLTSSIPVKFQLIDLDGSTVPPETKKISPEAVNSGPFSAMWQGISDKRLFWPDRWAREMVGLPSQFREAVLDNAKGPRKPSDMNYVITARDYVNLNARISYHYAMVDAIVSSGSENNYVHFRFRGNGGSEEKTRRCAAFLETVLHESGFGTDRHGNTVNAWYRYYPREDSEKALTLIGRLMVCSRELDAVLRTDSDVKVYADCFTSGNFNVFS